MTSNINVKAELKPVKTILVSQPKPRKSPYHKLEQKYSLQIDFRSFIHVEEVSEREFRKTRIKPDDYTAVIFTSRKAISNFFRICEEMRVTMPSETKYFCISKAVATFLQKFIVYRKRKVFVGVRKIQDLGKDLRKHKKEKFILPCSNLGSIQVQQFLETEGINYQEAMMYRTVASDLSDLSDISYDVLVFFSPLGIDSLYENFPNFSQKDTRIAAFGTSTSKAVIDRGLNINIKAPSPEIPSMTMALEQYIQKTNEEGR